MSDSLLQERRGPVLVVTLNRPEARNAVDFDVMTGLAEAVETAEADPEIRAIVLTAAGDKAFSAGMDLRMFAASKPGDASATPAAFLRLMEGEVTVPVVTAVNGVAVGAGCELVLGSDVVVAAESASFGLPEVKRGMFAGIGVMHIARRLPLGVALELTLTGERIDAARAQTFGFVNHVVPADQVLDTAVELATRIAANAPLSLAASKELVRKSAAGAPDARERLAEWQQRVFASADAREGAMAFVEKRAPVWQGR